MKQHYIYLTTNLVNGKQYIGQHYGELNDSYYGSGVIITKAIQEYGKENFTKEILAITTQEEIDELEKFYIAQFNAVESDNFYNLSEGGQQGNGWTHAHKYWQDHPEEAKRVYQENITKLQQWWRDHPEELKANNERLVENARKWREANPELVQEHMKEVNAAKLKWQETHPEEHQNQIDAWRMAGSKANSQQIECITTNELFESISAAGRHYHVPQANISMCLAGKRKSAGKHPETGEKLTWRRV